MLKRSIEKLKNGGKRITCPVHESTKATSQWAQLFYRVVAALSVGRTVHGIVWDWFDVPENHHMHIDATVFAGAECFRFEIDGQNHFLSSETLRSEVDMQKDAVLRKYNIRLLRLHYRDAGMWSDYISQYIRNTANTVLATIAYSRSYLECLEEHEQQDVIHL